MYQYTDYQYSGKYNLIKNILIKNKITAIKPVAFILGGQPGAGCENVGKKREKKSIFI